MGEVYRARDTRLGRDVAVKVLPERFADDPEAMARFEREARAVAGLSHPNILALHDFGSDAGISFAVMELLEGETLRDELQNGRLSPRKAADYARQIAEGLAVAHEKGVVHRDLKPENLFLTKDGRVKILDFGLARMTPLVESQDTHSPTAAIATEPGAILGTVGYMSPEQVRGKSADARSDIFALGAVLYESLTGRRAFVRETAAETMTAIMREEPEEIGETGSRVPATLDHIVRRCLEKKPEQRFQSSRDLAFALSEATGSSFTSGSIPGLVTASPRKSWRRAVLPAAAVLLAAAAFFTGRKTTTPASASEGWRFLQLTFGTSASLPSISPDGQQFVFVRREGKELDIFLQRVGGQNAVNLTHGAGFDNTEPAFSPDGTHVAFRSEREGGGIYVMGATGESVHRVAEGGFGPSWSPDGASLVFTTSDFQDPYHLGGGGNIVIVDLQSGKKRELLKGLSLEATLGRPAWSPHGRRIALFGILGTGSQRDLFTLDAKTDKSTPVRLTNDKPLDWAPAWAADGHSIYFGSDRAGTLDLYRMGVDEVSGRATSRPERIAVPAGSSGPYSPSLVGDRIAFEADSTNYGLQRFSVDPARHELTGNPRTILTGLPFTSYLAVSPDGHRIVFQMGVARENLYTCDMSGGNLTQLTDDEFKNRQPRWLADGKRLLFYSTRGGPYQLWEIGADGGQARPVTAASIGQTLACIPTADGKRIATVLETASSLEYAILDRRSDGMYAVEHEHDRLPAGDDYTFPLRWSPDDRSLLVNGTKGTAIASLDTGAIEPISPSYCPAAWISNDLVVYGEPNFQDPSGEGGSALLLYDRKTKARKVLYRFPAEIAVGGDIDVSPDGRSLYLITNLSRSDIWMMERAAAAK